MYRSLPISFDYVEIFIANKRQLCVWTCSYQQSLSFSIYSGVTPRRGVVSFGKDGGALSTLHISFGFQYQKGLGRVKSSSIHEED
jgi:hypothetical protein